MKRKTSHENDVQKLNFKKSNTNDSKGLVRIFHEINEISEKKSNEKNQFIEENNIEFKILLVPNLNICHLVFSEMIVSQVFNNNVSKFGFLRINFECVQAARYNYYSYVFAF